MMEDEYVEMSDIMMIERPFDRRPLFKISWKMTDFCPYSCPYCYMSNLVKWAKSGKPHSNPTQEAVEEIAKHIDECYEKLSDGQPFQLHLIGGEPSIYDLIKVLDKIGSDKFSHLTVASNIFRPMDYWKDLKSYCESRKIELGVPASLHLSQLNTEEKRQEYIDKVLENRFQCKAVINPENLSEYKPFFDIFMKNNIGIELTYERDENNTCCVFNEEQTSYINSIRTYQTKRRSGEGKVEYYKVTLKDGRTINYSSNISLINHIKDGHLDPTGFYCTAGMYNIRINSDGLLLRSACRYCSAFYKMGNIFNSHSYDKVTDMIECSCHPLNANGIYKDKYCTCFNNTNMYRKGYDKVTGIYKEEK